MASCRKALCVAIMLAMVSAAGCDLDKWIDVSSDPLYCALSVYMGSDAGLDWASQLKFVQALTAAGHLDAAVYFADSPTCPLFTAGRLGAVFEGLDQHAQRGPGLLLLEAAALIVLCTESCGEGWMSGDAAVRVRAATLATIAHQLAGLGVETRARELLEEALSMAGNASWSDVPELGPEVMTLAIAGAALEMMGEEDRQAQLEENVSVRLDEWMKSLPPNKRWLVVSNTHHTPVHVASLGSRRWAEFLISQIERLEQSRDDPMDDYTLSNIAAARTSLGDLHEALIVLSAIESQE